MEKINILVIDDDALISDMIKLIIKNYLPESVICSVFTKDKALSILQEQDFSLITLDGNLGGENHGRDVLKQMTPEQVKKTVVCSGEFDFVMECSKNGISAVNKNKDLFEVFEIILTSKGLI